MIRPFLEGTDVARSFGGLRVLTRVGFAVAEGEIVALIGPNGAGKTTLFSISLRSSQTVIMALLGGATTVVGPVLGAVFLGLLGCSPRPCSSSSATSTC
jgi:ABC-type multidrug transport system ATPase subunit